MKQNMVETILGAFVLTVAIIFFIFGTSTASIGSGGGTYIVNAQFTDIGSLGVGDDVKISGVVVGQVAAIELDPVIYNASVDMAIDDDVELPYDTSARITSEGLLGGTYMALDVGGDSEMLVEGDSIAITQSAQNLEQLLGQFIFSLQDTNNE